MTQDKIFGFLELFFLNNNDSIIVLFVKVIIVPEFILNFTKVRCVYLVSWKFYEFQEF